ncbi:helicase-related protein [Sporosarcina sp. YIM B06819]|uniref:helicase-related protein n=1 Tax=Sporosarcina sp. YIM B06819 TaxID=3081769 RepID=UPI00298C383F|nr:helicase-related protein [Sporosarcina sp. YIM B06819]
MIGTMLDNKSNGTVGDAVSPYLKKGYKVSIMASLFSIHAYDFLKRELNDIESVRLLLSEPAFTQAKEHTGKGTRQRESMLSGTQQEYFLRNNLNQAKIAKECADWIKNKVDVKAMVEPSPALNVYISQNRKNEGAAIQGNSSFTAEGLGFVSSPALHMNTATSETQDFIKWFDEIWEDPNKIEPIKEVLLKRLELLYRDQTPEFLYFVTLYNIFKEYVEEFSEDEIIKEKTGFKDTVIWNKLYKFQKDGVVGAIDKLEKYNGCIIADSVGLGKTFEGLAVIKYYELRNDRVLVLCPKKLRENWLVYTQNDRRNSLNADRFNYDVLNHTDLSRYEGISGDINLSTINWANYDLVVIDESHNFRNNSTRKDRETRYSRLMKDIIQSGVKTKVLMLSATPVNNKMNDLKNQVAFITEGKDDALKDTGIDSINSTLRNAQTIFNRWLKFSEKERTSESLLEMLNFDYFRLLDTLTIARSRKHIEKYYNMSEIGKFPDRLKPINIKAEIDEEETFPKISEVNRIINRLNLSAYAPLKYVLPDKQEAYSQKYDMQVKGGSVFKQIDRESSLIHLMRVNMLKRMESSISSFGFTVSSLLKRIDDLVVKLESQKSNAKTDVSIQDINFEDDDFDDQLIGSKVKVLLQDVDRIKWLQDLKSDQKILEGLLIETAKITEERDAKLNHLKKAITDKIKNPLNPANKKVLVFTAFADTATYLYEHLSTWLKEEHGLETALVVGSGSNKTTIPKFRPELNAVLTHFSPLSKERNKIDDGTTAEIDLLIATDCISEGQNLQDCDFLVNYDIHWNPVRIIQRFGRVDRLGSKNDVIQLVNFWPNMELEEYISLEARVSGRMILLDISATGEENVIDESTGQKMNDLEYRAKQLKQLQETVIDLEDISGSISITDLTLNDFKMDLIDYMEVNKGEVTNAQRSLFAIANKEMLPEEFQEEGIIFCLRHTQESNKIDEKSALYPFFLVYMNPNGTIKLGHSKTKQILDLFRKACQGQRSILTDLVTLFNEETNFQEDMTPYTGLLKKASEFVLGVVEETGMTSLFSLGQSALLQNVAASTDDFEVISFLIIK